MGDHVVAAVTLALRGERVPLRNTISSVYNPVAQQLLVASGPVLCLYGKLLETGGEIVATLQAEPNVQFQFVLYLAWLDVYSVVAAELNGRVQHRIVSTDLKTSTVSHVITDGTFVTTIANPHRRELVTVDSDGGLKVWALRAATSSTAAAGGLKGILRVHTATASTQKPLYQQLCLAANGQRILACTSRKVHVIDAAACTLQSSCSLAHGAAIERIEYSATDDCVYALFKGNKRTICKFRVVHKKAHAVMLKKTSEYTAGSDSVAFCCTADSDFESIPQQRIEMSGVEIDATVRGLFVLDDCGQLGIASFAHKTACDHTVVKYPQLGLQMNPRTERYVALHSELRPYHRRLLFLVCSSALYVIEAFLPRPDRRLGVTPTGGKMMKRLMFKTAASAYVTVYETTPVPRVMLFENTSRNIQSVVLLNVPGYLQDDTGAPASSAAGATKSSSVRLVDISVVNDSLVVLWSNGAVQTYAPSNGRMQAVLPLHTSSTSDAASAPMATAMALLRLNTEQFLAIGDARGTVSVMNVTFETTQVCGQRDAHSESVAALCALNSPEATRVANALALASVSDAGDVKLWRLSPRTLSENASVVAMLDWDLVACFRTCSVGVSAVQLLSPAFLFVGFVSGSIECWHLPHVSTTSSLPSTATQQQQSTGRIAVVRRPLHALDIHLSPVQHIACETTHASHTNTRVGTTSAASTDAADVFSWVVSVDDAGVVLVWCFSRALFFPHRRVQVHDRVRGCFLTHATPSSHQLIAYVGKCVELLDELTQGDRDAVRDRIELGKALSRAQSAATVRDVDAIDSVAAAASASSYSVDADSMTTAAAAAVRIRITLPGVDATEVRKRLDTRNSPPKRQPPGRAACIDVALHSELDSSVDASMHPVPQPNRSSRFVSKHPPANSDCRVTATAEPLGLHTPAIVADHVVAPQLERVAQRMWTATTSTTHASPSQSAVPVLSSVPSTFRNATPIVYRSRFTPADAAVTKQTQCNVVTTGSASVGVERTVQRDSDSSSALAKRHTSSSYEPQERVAVVSLADLDDASVLMLDFRASTRRRRRASTPRDDALASDASSAIDSNAYSVAWTALTTAQQRVELMAATKSRSVQTDAARDGVAVPLLEAFSSADVKMQLAVHAFMRWFAVTSQSSQSPLQSPPHQPVRERFLLEELAFAGADPVVHAEMALLGLCVPSPASIGVSSATEWRDFVAWYTGSVVAGASSDGSTIATTVSNNERLEARTRYLQHRLHVVQSVEAKLREAAAESLRDDRAFVFETFEWPVIEDDVMAWSRMSDATRKLELALALLDPDVQIAALTSGIELPDIDAAASRDDIDVLKLAGAFVPWWHAAGNTARRAWLLSEVDEAADDASTRTLLQETGADIDMDTDAFNRAYFASEAARLAFLERKLAAIQRLRCIKHVAMFSKRPTPVVVLMRPRPLMIAFAFPELLDADESNDSVDDSLDAVEQTPVPETSDDTDLLRDADAAAARALQLEAARIAAVDAQRAALETALLAIEDALALELRAQLGESDDEDAEALTPLTRSDFSRSYFFGHLPSQLQLPPSGWSGGSGIDNGDEEADEDERLALERAQQQLLDAQEAARLADAERRAEQARLDKERDDRLREQRRVRQLELRAVLTHQSELEARRRAEVERDRLAHDAMRIAADDARERLQCERLAAERAAMQHEDDSALADRTQCRDAAAQMLRLTLHEQTHMAFEDAQSRAVAHARAVREAAESARRHELIELYTPFVAATHELSNDVLPIIESRHRHHRHSRQRIDRYDGNRTTAPYALPFTETLVLDELAREPYVARDSRKFNMLLGLPMRTAKRYTRTTTTNNRVRSRSRDRCDEADSDDRVDDDDDDDASERLPALPHHTNRAPTRLQKPLRTHTRSGDSSSRTWKDPHDAELSDIGSTDARVRSNTAIASTLTRTSKARGNERNESMLPFFRGHLLVRGEATQQQQPARANDYRTSNT